MANTKQLWVSIVDEATLAAALNLCEIWLKIDAFIPSGASNEMLEILINEIEAYEAIHHHLPLPEWF